MCTEVGTVDNRALATTTHLVPAVPARMTQAIAVVPSSAAMAISTGAEFARGAGVGCVRVRLRPCFWNPLQVAVVAVSWKQLTPEKPSSMTVVAMPGKELVGVPMSIEVKEPVPEMQRVQPCIVATKPPLVGVGGRSDIEQPAAHRPRVKLPPLYVLRSGALFGFVASEARINANATQQSATARRIAFFCGCPAAPCWEVLPHFHLLKLFFFESGSFSMYLGGADDVRLLSERALLAGCRRILSCPHGRRSPILESSAIGAGGMRALSQSTFKSPCKS